MQRRDFVRKGSLWIATAVVIDPDMLGWTRRLWPGANIYRYGTGIMLLPIGAHNSYMPAMAVMSTVPLDVVQAYQRYGYRWHARPQLTESQYPRSGHMEHEYVNDIATLEGVKYSYSMPSGHRIND